MPWLTSGVGTDTWLVADVGTTAKLTVCAAVLLTGALTDLVDTPRLLRGVHVALAAVALGVATVVLADVVGPGLLLIMATVMGLGRSALVAGWPPLVGGLPLAIVSVGHELAGRVFHGSLASLTIAAVGIGAALCADAGAFVAVALSLRRIPGPRAAEPVTLRRVRAVVQDGVHTMLWTPSARNVVLLGAVAAFGMSALWSLFVVVARVQLALSEVGFGLLEAAAGVGAVGGIVLVTRLSRRRAPAGVVMRWLVAAGGCGVGLVSAGPTVPTVAVGAVAVGGVWVGCVIVMVVVLQSAVPCHARATAVGVGLASFYLSSALGGVLWGHVASRLNVSAALAAAGGLMVAGALVSVGLRMGRLPRH